MRSALFVPGDSDRKLAKGLMSGADCLLVDLEDSVAPDSKPAARATTLAFLKQHIGEADRPLLYVRCNALDTGQTEDDLSVIMAGKPDGVMLPKSGHGGDVTELDARLRVHEANHDIDDGETKIIAIVTETAAATLKAGSYERSSKRLTAMTWGAEDLAADIGALERRNENGTYRDTFRFARIQTLLGAVAAKVQPLDTVFPDFRDEAGFETECKEAMLDGFTGKMAIHPAQVPIINKVFTPSDAQIERAQAIVEAFTGAGNAGVIGLDGEMLDRPHLINAERLLARVRAMRP